MILKDKKPRIENFRLLCLTRPKVYSDIKLSFFLDSLWNTPSPRIFFLRIFLRRGIFLYFGGVLFYNRGMDTDILENPRFEAYFDLLTERNKVMNLTAITDRQDVYKKHFKDSLLPIDYIPEGASVLDIGSGAGFPGIPIAIARGDIVITLADSLKKRVDFLNDVIARLQLTNCRALHVRIEDFKERERFDTVVSRAVAALCTLAEYALPFVKKGGTFIAYKGNDIAREVEEAKKAISVLGGEVEDIVEIPLDEEIMRKFVIIKKKTATPAKYPRGGNKPRLSPIK